MTCGLIKVIGSQYNSMVGTDTVQEMTQKGGEVTNIVHIV